MAYAPDQKLQGFDEESQANSRTDVGWEPISHEKMVNMREIDGQMKQRLRTVRLFVRVCTFALACFMLYTQVYMLNKYLSTRGIIRDGRDAWATQTTIWPTILLLTTSALTVLFTSATLISYAWSVKAANFAAVRIYAPWVAVEVIAHIVVWVAVMVAYRVGKTGDDLWGWSCSGKAQDIQSNFLEVDFNYSCDLQSNAWFVSIAEAALLVVTGLAWTLAWRRNAHQKKLRYRESLLMSHDYQQYGQLPPPPRN